MTRKTRARAPSGAVQGTVLGGAIATIIEIVAIIVDHPLPAGTAAPLGLALSTVFGYIARGGRRGEGD